MGRRVEQIVRISRDAGRSGRGSGYVIAPGLVLTAGHVVDGLDDPARLHVGRLPGGDLTVTEIIRAGSTDLDIALLRVRKDDTDEVATYAVVDVDEPVEMSATGFPRVQRQDQHRDPENVRGVSEPLSGPHDAISLDVTSSVPIDEAGWSGFSGAAVFTVGGMLLGVVVTSHSGFGGRRLEAVPITRLLDDPRLRPALPTAWHSSARRYLSHLLAFRIGSDLSIRVRGFEPLMTASLRESLLASWLKPLRAEFQVVPFIGRDEALGRLSGWLSPTGPRFSFAVVTGPAGSGKSRTAAELCRRAIADGWVAGLAENWTRTAQADLANLRLPVLLVQDYMDNSAEAAANFIERAIALDRKEPIRVLFLVRSADRFIRQVNAGMTYDDILPAEVIRLQSQQLTEPERREHYDRASAAFATLRGVDRPAGRTGDRVLAAYPTPLLVHAQALVDLIDEPDETGDADPDALAYRLLDRLLGREDEKFWEPALTEFHVRPDTRQDCFAIASIVDAVSADDAGRLLTLARGLDGKVDLATAIAERMSEIYADEGFLPPVQPDLLGERLVERRLLDNLKIDKLFVVADAPAQRSRMLEILLRMCGSPYPSARGKATAALERILGEHLTELVGQAVAYTSGPGDPVTDPLADRVAAALSLVQVPGAAVGAARVEFPLASRMQALAAAVYEQAAQHAEQEHDQNAMIDMLQKATIARIQAGQPDAALPLSSRMMSVASRVPDLGQQQRLGRVLGSQSLVRVWTGNATGAVESARRAVSMIEEAAQESEDPGQFVEALAESRNILVQVLIMAAEPLQAAGVLADTVADLDQLPPATAIKALELHTLLANLFEEAPEALWATSRARELLPVTSEDYAVQTIMLASLHDDNGDETEALRFVAEAIDSVDALPNQTAEQVRYRRSMVRFVAGSVILDRDEETAERYLAEARAELGHLFDDAPELYGSAYVAVRLAWAAIQTGEQAFREMSIITDIVDDLFQRRPGTTWGLLILLAIARVPMLVDAERVTDAVAVVDETVEKIGRFEMPGGAAAIASLFIMRAVLISEYLEDDDAALAAVAEACRIYEKLVAENPVQFLGQLVHAQIARMAALDVLDRTSEVMEASQEAISNAERFGELIRSDLGLRLRAAVLTARGRIHRDNDRLTEALADLRAARADLAEVTAITDEDEIEELDEEILELAEHLGVAPELGDAPEPRPALPVTAAESGPAPVADEVPTDETVAAALGLAPVPKDGTAKVVVAIDFGTNGTGYAFALVSPENDDPTKRTVYFRDEWPKAPARGAKDLSAIVVDENLKPVAWGYEAYSWWQLNSAYKRAELKLRGYAYAFKMALSTHPENRRVARSEGDLDLDQDATVRRLIVSMLRYMREQVMARLKSLDVGLTPDDIRWCITVPAIWTDAQKQLMRQTAEEAGLDPADQVVIAIEPETAALYGILDARRRGTDASLEAGEAQRFMVVDCGGGTIDISAFSGSMTDGRLQLAEIGGGSTGAALGSQYVNAAFRTELLPARLGVDPVAFLEENHAELLSELENQWEKAKQSVAVAEGDDGRPVISGPVYLDLTGVWKELPGPVRKRLIEAADGEGRTLFVTADEVQALFDKIIDPIVRLVRRAFTDLLGHVHGAPITVLLVGGFAVNDYLRARIGHELQGEATVIRPAEPREAVLHGAVHFCYDPRLITQRRARRTYGFQIAMPLRSGTKDLEHDIFRPEGSKQWLCRDRFQIAVRRSQAIDVSQTYQKVLTPSSAETAKLQVSFFSSRRIDPEYVSDEGVDRLAEITIDISGSVGRPPAERKVRLEMSFGDTTITATVTTVDTGERQKVDIPFETRFDDPDAL
ncbi:trypsin-like peptidase domain-containing protein [Actinoplanes sp. HUAS TT8]|uniref:trypsin-like peptidase domain-containing protein n=1 Tax=Actinoplanes sp. HUAS TT8 TaxID=3447453 RepID=UPI003F52907F